MMNIFAPDIPADVHSVIALSAAITSGATMATLTSVALRHIDNMVKDPRPAQPHNGK